MVNQNLLRNSEISTKDYPINRFFEQINNLWINEDFAFELREGDYWQLYSLIDAVFPQKFEIELGEDPWCIEP